MVSVIPMYITFEMIFTGFCIDNLNRFVEIILKKGERGSSNEYWMISMGPDLELPSKLQI